MLHLIKRFFGSLFARPLTGAESSLVQSLLSADLAELFFAMSRADQRHSLTVFVTAGAEPALAEAALLHDVGKTESQLGPISRSLATIADGIGLRLSGRWRDYRDHGAIGAEMLRNAGAGRLAVAFAEHHPGEAPDDIDPAVWQRLATADQV